MSKEVEINGKKFSEDTKISLSVKTLAWIIGGLIFAISTLATIGYLDIKDNQKRIEEDFKSGKIKYKEDLRNIIKEELGDLREKDIQFIKDIGEMKGDIKVILDRTVRSDIPRGNNNNTVPISNNNLPTINPIDR